MNRPDEKDKGLVLKEYGRNTQRLVDYLLTIEDRGKRSVLAQTLIDLMKQLNPAMNDHTDHTQKLWDHLYIMSNFTLDVDTQYPMPEKSILDKKPVKVDYNMNNLRFKHYGRNIELLIKKAIEQEEPQAREEAIIYLGRLMKRFYSIWNKENVDDKVILEHMDLMSKGKLGISAERVRNENLFDITLREPAKDQNKHNTLHNVSSEKEFSSNNNNRGNGGRSSNHSGGGSNFRRNPTNNNNNNRGGSYGSGFKKRTK